MSLSNRRGFIQAIAAGGAVLGSGITSISAQTRRTIKKAQNGDHTVVYRKLGTTGFDVSEVGFGAMNTRNAELIHAAIDAGINYIDTAHGYMRGENERIVGQVMKTKRDKVFLVTKVHARDKNPAEIREMMETSLKRLSVDSVDCMFMHMPPSPKEAFDEYHPEVFEKAKQDGLCRFIGVSTHQNHADTVNGAADNKIFDLILVGYNYESPPEVTAAIAKARKAGIGIIGMKTQLKGKGWPDHTMGDITINQAALKWVLQDSNVDTTIPGMTTFEQLAEDIAVMGMQLSFNDRRELMKYADSLEGSYCRGVSGCTGCQGQCPYGVDICEINRCLGYANGYSDIRLARENIAELPKEWLAEKCGNCDECTVSCIHGLDLAVNVRRAREIFV